MTPEQTQLLNAALAVAGPLLLGVFGMLPSAWLNRHARLAARAGAGVSLAALVFAGMATAGKFFWGDTNLSWAVAGPFRLGVYFDNLSAVVLTLVAFLLAVVARFSVNYLAGDPQQGRFFKWLCLCGGSVLTLAISGNLLQFALAWSASSWCLHRLLVFYPDRPAAVLAARKKFLISRLGDLFLGTVIILVLQQFHSWEFSEIFAAAARLHHSGSLADGWAISAICFLLVAGAMLKSAQFPFHTWLPDTMETPTPVSALMHAGIINAGGFLIIRLSVLVTLSPAAMSVLALFGAFTALFASLVMLTHASVKRALAFSTVAQMGFMMLECGLGAFGLALLHLVAHSLYKAHAFLSSGSIVRLKQFAWVPTERPSAHPLILAFSLGTAAALAALGLLTFAPGAWREPGQAMLICVFTMALGYVLWNLWSRQLGLTLGILGIAAGAGLLGLYLGLHDLCNSLLAGASWQNTQLDSWSGLVLLVTLAVLFLLVLVVQTEMPQWANRPFFQSLYVHARNGFYFNTLANRIMAALWPAKGRLLKH
jgi:NAD(P)H-quinone oxidoreductase subunit 5